MKNMVKAIVCIFVVLGILTGLSQPVYADSEFNHSTLDGIVLVYMDIVVEDEYLGSGTGTGFFVGLEETAPQYIVTNYHVIEYYVKSGGGQGQSTLVVAYDQKDYEEAYVVAYDVEKDLAILKIADPTTKRKPLALKTTTEDLVGSTAFAIGFPAIADETIESVTLYGKNDASVTGGRINRIITESGTGRGLLQIDVNIRGGNSGGPLVNTDGYVLGINTLASTLDNNLNYAVSIDELLPLLNNNNIPYQMEEASGWSQYILIIVIAGAALLLLIVVIILLAARGKKRKSVPATAAALQQPLETPKETPKEAPVATQRTARPVVRSMSSQHGGMTVALSRQPIIIGRDVSACRIIFKEGTNGVSSKHCQLYFDEQNNSFILIDLKSTYGTFLTNGQRLASNVPYTLKARDSFYLGESDNILYVDLE